MKIQNKVTILTIIVSVLLFNTAIVKAENIEFKKIKPTAEIIEQAKNNPNTWVYVIDGDYSGAQEVPQDAIVGSWQVDDKGEIMQDSFLINPNYKKITDTKNSI